MGYTYPRLCNWLTFHPAGNGNCIVQDNIRDISFSFDYKSAWYIQQLNGKRHPYRISTDFERFEVDHLLSFLRDHNLLRDSRILEKGFGRLLVSLWICPIRQPGRKLGTILNGLLMTLFLPVFLLGMFIGMDSFPALGTVSLSGMLWGLLIGVILHEIGHSLAAWAYGANVFEIGLTFHWCIPGAYTLMNIDGITNTYHKAQVNAAGIEVNLLLCGVLLGLARAFPSTEIFMVWAAFENIVLALINIMFVSGLDGANVISALLRNDSMIDCSKLFLLDQAWRHALLNSGKQGRMEFIACAILGSLQLSGIALAILNLMGGLICLLSFL